MVYGDEKFLLPALALLNEGAISISWACEGFSSAEALIAPAWILLNYIL